MALDLNLPNSKFTRKKTRRSVVQAELEHLAVNSDAVFKEPTTNYQQTTNKLEPIQSQTRVNSEPNRSQTGANSEPNRGQTEAKPEPIQSQTRAKIDGEDFPLDKTRATNGAKLEPIQSQTRAKLGTQLEPNSAFLLLSGLQKKALYFLFNSCLFNGSKKTEPIFINEMASTLETTSSAAKKAIQRLEEKEFISRYKSKSGRGGWTIYLIPDAIFKELSFNQTRAKLEPIQSQTRAKLGTQLEPQLEPNPPSSSISLNTSLNTTTTDESKIDCRPLNKLGLKFGLPQIKQLVEAGRTLSEIQDAIEFFAFDIAHNDKLASVKTDPVNYLMGILRKSSYSRPLNYQSVAEIEAKKTEYDMAMLLQEKERLQEEVNDLRFEKWWNELSAEQRSEFSPEKVGAGDCQANTFFHLSFVKEKFLNEVLPTLN